MTDIRVREPQPPSSPDDRAEGGARLTACVCKASSCLAEGSAELERKLEASLTAQHVNDVTVKPVGCIGLCSAGPLVQVPETGALFTNVDDAGITKIVGHLQSAKSVIPKPAQSASSQQPFFARQQKIVLENCGLIDPDSIDDYVARDGYAALIKAVTTLSPTKVVDEISRSGLRGRGGAGYSTGLKWATVAKQNAEPKYVVCNADEGDPGAFMDRSVLVSDPHRVLEGMAIAAYAVGATRGYIYCRAEYPLAIQRLKTAIKAAEHAGYLGGAVADSRFAFHVEIRVGAGAYVCGEETALMASIQGGRGTPVPRPPYPAASGLWGKPTLINNVETFAAVPTIIRRGGDWYASIGVGKSKGTKVFALAGRIVNSGLIEVPLGISLREVIYDIGGGIPNGGTFKAVQTGGPSGGCLPEELLDISLDYESLAKAGTIIGSGGMVVMDQTSCMVDVARYFLDFCRDESCGKCVPCRVGTTELYLLLTAICEGRATRTDLARLEDLSETVSRMSLCGLGQNAPTPIFSTLRYFRDEYLAHIDDHVCPAGVCPVETRPAGARPVGAKEPVA